MRTTILATMLAAVGMTASAQTVILDTFNEADQANLFDCCNVLPVTAHTPDADKVSVAIPFTPEAFAKITEVDIALSWQSAFALKGEVLRISVTGSENGLPGREKKVWHRNPPGVGQCCAFLALRPGQAIHAEPVGQYWIVVSAQHHSAGGWNLNSMGESGPYAIRTQDGPWTMTEGPLPAVRIIAK